MNTALIAIGIAFCLTVIASVAILLFKDLDDAGKRHDDQSREI